MEFHSRAWKDEVIGKTFIPGLPEDGCFNKRSIDWNWPFPSISTATVTTIRRLRRFGGDGGRSFGDSGEHTQSAALGIVGLQPNP